MKVEQRGQLSGGWMKLSDEWIGEANRAESNRCGEMKRAIDADVTGEKWVKKTRVAVKIEVIASKFQMEEEGKLVITQSQSSNI